MGTSSTIARAKYHAQLRLLQSSWGLAAMGLRPKYRPLVVGPRTDVVIEGFPRSANTFATVAFQMAQSGPVSVAHHLHSPMQVVWAVRWCVPCLVLLRNPDDAVSSLIVRHPYIGARLAYEAYARFYERIVPIVDHCVLGPFGSVTSDFGSIIEAMNRRYGTGFAPFEHSDANVARCFALVEELDRADSGLVTVSERTVARPSATRETIKKQVGDQIQRVENDACRLRAHRVYGVLRGG